MYHRAYRRWHTELRPFMIWQRTLALPFLFVVAAFLWRFPVGQAWLAAGFAAYAILLLKYPRAWLVVVPAAMPALDLAVFSGWYFFDEFDALVLLTLAILLWRQKLTRDDFRVGWPLAVALTILAASYLISMTIELVPWPAVDGNAFASYYSPFNAARIAKGFLWPLLLLPYLNQAIRSSSETERTLVGGLLLGLLAVCLIGLVEKWLFVGLFTFDQDYRISGPFSSMHTGDGHIDLWLAATIPLLLAPFVRRWAIPWRLGALGLCGLALYILLATASRGPFLAIAAAFLAMVFAFALIWVLEGRLARTLLLYPMVLGLCALVAVPFLIPTELGNRFKQTGKDFQTRIDHFSQALSLRDSGMITTIFGMGLGTFPRTYDARGAGQWKLARYSFDGPGQRRYLTLTSGDNLYFGQVVETEPFTQYLLSFGYRTNDPKARLTVSICEKWLLHSRDCSWNSYELPATGDKWVQYSAMVKMGGAGRSRGRIGKLSRRPIHLALHTAGVTEGLSLDDIALVAGDGRNLLRNGNFSRTNDHWFWVVDNHLPWHTKNMAINVLFDQGWFGLFAVILIAALAMGTIMRAICAERPEAIPWFGAMVGYLVAVVAISPFDQPRLAMLFYLICLFSALQFRRRRQPDAVS